MNRWMNKCTWSPLSDKGLLLPKDVQSWITNTDSFSLQRTSELPQSYEVIQQQNIKLWSGINKKKLTQPPGDYNNTNCLN